MKQTVSKSMFRDAFKSVRPDNFTYEGLGALYEYFTEMEDSCGEETELDVIAICCEWSEDRISNILENYNLESLEDLQDNTCVVWVDGQNVIYAVY